MIQTEITTETLRHGENSQENTVISTRDQFFLGIVFHVFFETSIRLRVSVPLWLIKRISPKEQYKRKKALKSRGFQSLGNFVLNQVFSTCSSFGPETLSGKPKIKPPPTAEIPAPGLKTSLIFGV